MSITNFRNKMLVAIFASASISTVPFSPQARAGGLTDFESMACIAATSEAGGDSLNCADADSLDCRTPDWFPTGAVGSAIGGSDAMNSQGVNDSVRFNEADYSVGSYRRWKHEWYSEIGTMYGPALPSWGHLWNEYDGATLVKSVSCDADGTYSYP